MQRLLPVLLLPIALLTCGGDGRIKLVVYSPHGEEILLRFEALFERAHPECDVIASNRPSQECLSTLRAERQNPRCDLFWGATEEIHRAAAAEGLLEAYRPSWIDTVDPRFQSPDDHYQSQFVMLQVLIYNDQRMTEADAPRGFADLLSGRFDDRIIVRLPPPSGTMRGVFAWLIAWQAGLHGGEVDSGFEFLRRLHRATKRYETGPTELFEAIQRDPDLVVSIWSLTDAKFQKATYDYPLGVRIPEEGTPVVVDCIALVKKHADDDPRRNALARAFYEYVTSIEASEILMRDHFRIPTRQDIPAAAKPDWLRDLHFEPLPADADLARAKADEWMTYWDENIKSLKR